MIFPVIPIIPRIRGSSGGRAGGENKPARAPV